MPSFRFRLPAAWSAPLEAIAAGALACWAATLPVPVHAAEAAHPQAQAPVEAVSLPPGIAELQPTEVVKLAVRYEHGEGVARDPRAAAELYCMAARAGDAEGQFKLGWMYANGRGIGRNNRVAASLFALAAQQGHDYAARMLGFVGQDKAELPPCLAGPEDTVSGPVYAAGSTRAENALYAHIPDIAPLALPDFPAGRTAELVEPLPEWSFASPERQRVVDLVRRLAPSYNIDPALALAIIQAESNFDPRAVSPKNARGLMQVLPETGVRFGVNNLFDPVQNVKAGLAYLRWLLSYFRGDVVLAAAAYNSGERTVDRYRGVPPFAETQQYVRKIARYFPRHFHAFDARVVEASPVVRSARGG